MKAPLAARGFLLTQAEFETFLMASTETRSPAHPSVAMLVASFLSQERCTPSRNMIAKTFGLVSWSGISTPRSEKKVTWSIMRQSNMFKDSMAASVAPLRPPQVLASAACACFPGLFKKVKGQTNNKAISRNLSFPYFLSLTPSRSGRGSPSRVPQGGENRRS